MKTYYKVVFDEKEYHEKELKRNGERILRSTDILCDLNFTEVVGTADTAEEAEQVAKGVDLMPYYYGASRYVMIPVVEVQKIDVDDDGEEEIDCGYDFTLWCDYEVIEQLINGTDEDEEDED